MMRGSPGLTLLLAICLIGSVAYNVVQWHDGVTYLDKVSIVEVPRDVAVEVPGPTEYVSVPGATIAARRRACPSVANALNRFERMTRHGQ